MDNQEQSDVILPDGWQSKTNIFIGAELTPVPNGDFNGKLGDVSRNEKEKRHKTRTMFLSRSPSSIQVEH